MLLQSFSLCPSCSQRADLFICFQSDVLFDCHPFLPVQWPFYSASKILFWWLPVGILLYYRSREGLLSNSQLRSRTAERSNQNYLQTDFPQAQAAAYVLTHRTTLLLIQPWRDGIRLLHIFPNLSSSIHAGGLLPDCQLKESESYGPKHLEVARLGLEGWFIKDHLLWHSYYSTPCSDITPGTPFMLFY